MDKDEIWNGFKDFIATYGDISQGFIAFKFEQWAEVLFNLWSVYPNISKEEIEYFQDFSKQYPDVFMFFFAYTKMEKDIKKD